MASSVGVILTLLLVFWIVGAYNRLISLRKHLRNAYAQIDAQLKRRYELVPHLVECAKDAMMRERDMLEAVIAACNEALAANTRVGMDPTNAAAVRQMAGADRTLTALLGKMLALADACRDLKANQNMQQLADQLAETENCIVFARQAYNDSAVQFNHSREQFPGSVIANMFAFNAAELLLPAGAQF